MNSPGVLPGVKVSQLGKYSRNHQRATKTVSTRKAKKTPEQQRDSKVYVIWAQHMDLRLKL